MSTESLEDLLRSVKHEPTPANWKSALSAAINGLLDDLLERLGGIESFVGSTVDNAVLPVACKDALNDALELFVVTWQPTSAESFSYTERLLRLIAARTPPSGFTKILGHLLQHKHFRTYDSVSHSSSVQYLDELAMSALNRYFPAPPPEPERVAAFEGYLTLLWDRLDQESYRGRACQRLLALNYLSDLDARFEELLASYFDEIAPAVLSWLLSAAHPQRARILTTVYFQSLQHSSTARFFREQLARNHIELVEESDYVYLLLRSGDAIKLWTDVESLPLAEISSTWISEAQYGRDETHALTFGS